MENEKIGTLALRYGLILASAVLLQSCQKTDPDEEKLRQAFDRDAVLVKTCRPDPGIASAIPLKVYRFQNGLWFEDRRRLRRVDGNVENVCDLLDVEQKH